MVRIGMVLMTQEKLDVVELLDGGQIQLIMTSALEHNMKAVMIVDQMRINHVLFYTLWKIVWNMLAKEKRIGQVVVIMLT